MTTATLGLAVDSSSVSAATPALDKMTAASRKAEEAALALSRADHTKAAAALSAARASGTATKEEIAAAAATVRKTKADFGATRAMRDAAAAAQKQAAALASVGAAQDSATVATQVNTVAVNANNSAMRMPGNMRTNMIFQLNDVGVSLASGMNPALVAMQQGSQILQYGLGPALKTMGDIAVGALTKFWPIGLAVGAATAAIAGMTAAINETSDVTVTFGDTALATWQVISGGLYQWVKPAIDAMAPWFADAWADVKRGTADAINSLARGWHSFVAEVQLVSESIKHIFDLTWGDIQNGFVDMMEVLLKSVWTDLNKILVLFGQTPVKVDLSLMRSDDTSDWSKKAIDRYDQQIAGIGQTDYAGALFGDVSEKAQDNARARELEEIGESSTKAAEGLKAANDNGEAFKQMLSDVAPLLQGANDPLTELQANMDTLGALLAAGEISWEQYGQAADRANTIAAAGVLDSVSQITGVLAGAFKENQALQAANVVVDTAAGVMKAYSQGGMFATPMALAIAAAGAVQLGSILSAKPGSASVAGAGGNAAAAQSAAGAPSAGQGAAAQKVVNVTIQGDYFSPESGARFLRSIQDALGVDGLQINTSHKQA